MYKRYTILAATAATSLPITVEATSDQEMHYEVKKQVHNWLANICRKVEDLTRVDLLRVEAV